MFNQMYSYVIWSFVPKVQDQNNLGKYLVVIVAAYEKEIEAEGKHHCYHIGGGGGDLFNF